MIDVARVDVGGVGFIEGEVLTIEFDGDGGSSFGCMDREALGSVTGVNGGGGVYEGCHGRLLFTLVLEEWDVVDFGRRA